MAICEIGAGRGHSEETLGKGGLQRRVFSCIYLDGKALYITKIDDK